MFSYKPLQWKYRITPKQLSIFFTCVYVLGLIPMLVLGLYDWPASDDFSMALQPHQYFAQTGNFFGTVIKAFEKAFWIYNNHVGYFFSDILTCLCPSVFGEGFYVLTPFLMLGMLTFGVCYFFDALFVRVWKLDRHLANAAAMLTLIMMIHCMEASSRVEAFYWYSGAINYTFTFGMAFFWIGLLLRSVYEETAAKRKRKLIWACIWGFFLGGANYMTALQMAICSVLILVIFFMVKRGIFKLEGADAGQEKSFGLIVIPAVINLAGFACACLAPGNATRSAGTEHYGPVKAVLLSLYYALDTMAGDMMRWEVALAVILLIPVFWLMAGRLKQRLQHPVLFVLFAYLMAASNITPPLFAVATLEAGRLKALAWMEFVFMLVMTVFYLTAWLRQHLEGTVEAKDTERFSPASTLAILFCILFIGAGSVLCVIPEQSYYSATAAAGDLLTGLASTYRQENLKRLEILKDESVKDAVLSEHTAQPEMLFFMDVTPDPEEWINTATARYYDKDSVIALPDK